MKTDQKILHKPA